MKHYTCPADLRQFGFDCLTGEACGLGMRLLYDITAPAKKVLYKALGVSDITLLQDWNGGDAIGSCLLPHEMATTLAIFSMLDNGCLEAWQRYHHGYATNEIYGLESQEELDLARVTKIGHGQEDEGFRVWRYSGTAADRNVHVMSGRVS